MAAIPPSFRVPACALAFLLLSNLTAAIGQADLFGAASNNLVLPDTMLQATGESQLRNLYDCTFTNNSVSSPALGIVLRVSDVTAIVSNSLFAANDLVGSAEGVVWAGNATIELIDSTFENNGTVALFGWATAFSLERTIFAGNAAGAIHADEGSVSAARCRFAGQGGKSIRAAATTLHLADVVFTNNPGGGILANDQSTANLATVDFVGNGQAVELEDCPRIVGSNLLFSGNSAHTGAAMLSRESSVELRNALFAANTGAYGPGVGMFGGWLDLEDVQFIGNSANSWGGAMYLSLSASQNMSRVRFAGNSAGGLGGAIFASGSGLQFLSRVQFEHNHSGQDGGAIYAAGGCRFILANPSVASNSAARAGGAFWVANASDVVLSATSNALYVGNQAPLGGFLAMSASGNLADNTPVFSFQAAPECQIVVGSESDVATDSIATLPDSPNAGINAILRKQGLGDLLLHAASTNYRGRVEVQAGRIVLGNSNARLGGVISVQSNAVLSGIGHFTDTVLVEPGGRIEPGFAAGDFGILGMGTALVASAGATFTFDLGAINGNSGSADQIRCTGSASLQGAVFHFVQVDAGNWTGSTNWHAGMKYDLIRAVSIDGIPAIDVDQLPPLASGLNWEWRTRADGEETVGYVAACFRPAPVDASVVDGAFQITLQVAGRLNEELWTATQVVDGAWDWVQLPTNAYLVQENRIMFQMDAGFSVISIGRPPNVPDPP
jgi:predicted outer membrane repeat protein